MLHSTVMRTLSDGPKVHNISVGSWFFFLTRKTLHKDEEKQLNPSQPRRDALDITAVSAIAVDKTTL
jgi:hypothetical protein